MLKSKKSLMAIISATLIILIATPAFARSISFKDAGVALWIFIIIGAVIVLLQLIPALILFFSFIGTTSSMALKRKKAPEEATSEEKVILPGYEPATVKK
jgi:flagellar basal body-associated protein FliL